MKLDEAIAQLGLLIEDQRAQLGSAVNHVAIAARIDILTGLQNGSALDEQLQEIFSSEVPHHFFFGDLNGFKDINDKHTHAAGDAALRIFSEKLQCISKIWNVQAFRRSGDEFALLVQTANVSEVVGELKKAFREFRVPFEEKVFDLSASFGHVAVKDCDIHTLKQRAEFACAEAKYDQAQPVVTEWTEVLRRKIVSRRFRCKQCSASVKCEVPADKADTLACPACGTPNS